MQDCVQCRCGDLAEVVPSLVRVLAVANMHVDQATWVAAYDNHDCGDQSLKEEGTAC